MAALTEKTAESLAKSRTIDGTYVEAYVARSTTSGAWVIRALMPVTATNGGGWVEVATDA
jgi:hypothetical protein